MRINEMAVNFKFNQEEKKILEDNLLEISKNNY